MSAYFSNFERQVTYGGEIRTFEYERKNLLTLWSWSGWRDAAMLPTVRPVGVVTGMPGVGAAEGCWESAFTPNLKQHQFTTNFLENMRNMINE